MLIECGVKVEEVREESSCGYLAGELVQVVVLVFRQVAYPALLLPYLDREDGRGAVPDPLVCGV